MRSFATGPGSGPDVGHGQQSTAVNEITPLLPNGDGAGATNNHRGGFWRQVFLDPKKTPGLDSPNPFVKWPVHVFNITKVVLLSSKCHHKTVLKK